MSYKSETKTIFSGWKVGRHHAVSPDGSVKLWVCNGFQYLGDDGDTALVTGTSFWVRWKLWREFKKEMNARALAAIEEGRRDPTDITPPQRVTVTVNLLVK